MRACLLIAFLGCKPTPVAPPAPALDAAPLEANVDAGGAFTVDAGRAFGVLSRDLSEPGQEFLTDNWVSNETSYLQIRDQLRGRSGGAYIGVGPEQNLSYIALVKPEIAFIVDLRRENTVEHLFYKAIFELAESRDEFRALLTGGANPRIHARVDEFLDARDRSVLEKIERVFHEQGFAIRFEMHDKNGRVYPTLQSLLDQDGSFLSSDEAFHVVQKMEREDRIIPVVGDFAGPHSLKAIAAEIGKRKLVVSAFYVSNVEQYVMQDGKWKAWLENVHALPHDEKSVFIRAYLDQGKPHPKQMKGHRTATVLQSFDRFESKSWGSWFALASDTML
jgi:hypothetical protein